MMTDDELSAALWAYLRAGFPDAAFPGNVTQHQQDFWRRAVQFVREADDERFATLERELAAERAKNEATGALVTAAMHWYDSLVDDHWAAEKLTTACGEYRKTTESPATPAEVKP